MSFTYDQLVQREQELEQEMLKVKKSVRHIQGFNTKSKQLKRNIDEAINEMKTSLKGKSKEDQEVIKNKITNLEELLNRVLEYGVAINEMAT